MLSSLPSFFFGLFLLLFVLLMCGSLYVFSGWQHSKSFLLVASHLASLLFVLTFILSGWRQPELRFVEVGQYYSLQKATGSDMATVSVGTADRDPDFVVGESCPPGPCFGGLIHFNFESKADSPNKLTWRTEGDFAGSLSVIQPRQGRLGWLLDGILTYLPLGADPGLKYTDGAAGVSLQGDVSSVVAIWEPPAGATSSASLSVPITIELSPAETAPRITLFHSHPRIVGLPGRSNPGAGDLSRAATPRTVFLTSSREAVALKFSTGGDGESYDAFTPIIRVGQANPKAHVTAFIELPDAAPQGAGEFVVNTGLSRTSNTVGGLAYIGEGRGIAATVDSNGGKWKYVWACVLLWLIPLVFFVPLARVGDLWALASVVQMLLAVRFVLALRAFLWPPYNQQAVESAVLALLFVPFLIFMGCFLVGLRYIGAARERRHKVAELIRSYPPVLYYGVAVAALPLISMVLRDSASGFDFGSIAGGMGAAPSHKALLLLIFLPPAVWLFGLFIDRRLRAGRARDVQYTGSAGEDDDPLMYRLLRPAPDARRPGAWERRHLVVFASVLAVGALTCWAWYLGRDAAGVASGELFSLGAGLLMLLTATRLRRFSAIAREINEVLAAATRAGSRLSLAVGLLLALKAAWNLSLYRFGFARAVPAALFPYLPLRTSAAFELLILILTFRLLTTFFDNWRDANAPFGRREMLNLALVFFTPALLFIVSLMASHDTGALLVHGPALVAATLLLSGLWPLWKAATGRREALGAIVLSLGVILLYCLVAFTSVTRLVTPLGPHNTITHRILLLEGTEAAARSAEVGGTTLLGAIEQNWRMLNYAAEGGWDGRGYGNAPVPRDQTFSNITLDDLVYAVYVLAEHGALGGLALILLYLLFFLVVLKLAWDRLDGDPVRVAFAVCLALAIVFPALYMMAANLNEGIFTGQNLPLLGLRSDSDVLRAGVILMLLAAALRLGSVEWPGQRADTRAQGWRRLVLAGLAMIRFTRARKAERLERLAFSPETSDAAVAGNMALVLCLVLAVTALAVVGIAKTSGNEDFKQPLDLLALKERAAEYVKSGSIWFEPLAAGETPGAKCRGGGYKNSPNKDPNIPQTEAYQLCVDDDVEGAARDDTLAALVRQWNRRKNERGNTAQFSYDSGQFFQLYIDRIRSRPARPEVDTNPALRINQTVYRWTSPFRPLRGWTGMLTSADGAKASGGALVGAGLALPLKAAAAEESAVFPGTDQVRVNIGQPTTYQPARAFSLYDPELSTSIFSVETVSGATGALLRPQGGDFDIFVNGCPLAARPGSNCAPPANDDSASSRGTAPPVRIDYGDVIAYAPRDPSGRRFPRHVFVYSAAQLGDFSNLAWVDGSLKRRYPQGASWPMAQQISKALATSAEGDTVGKDVVLTVDAALNSDLYELLRGWRGELQRRVPVRQGTRRMSITLMDTNTGEVLALASDDGTPFDPNVAEGRVDDRPNLNLTRHRIGSVIKPLTAAATLSVFPRLQEMTLVDARSNKQNVFGLPLGGRGGIIGRGGATNIPWQNFLPRSDNLYAITFSLLGMCEAAEGQGAPKFERGAVGAGPFTLELNDGGSNLGMPRWPSPNMFDVQNNRVSLLQQTPLARRLQDLFGARAGDPEVSSYDTGLWSGVLGAGWRERTGAFNIISPEVTNFAFTDINNFGDLRSVLLGGEMAGPEEYGNIGSAWSNVELAQAFARIVTGRRIEARIVAGERPLFPELLPGLAEAGWRLALMRSLERVANDPSGTAYVSLHPTIERVAAGRAGRFTVMSKTGTLDPDNFGPGVNGRLESDSIFVFTAGLWDNARGEFTRSVTGAIYIEQASEQVRELAAPALAARVIQLLDKHPRFKWSSR